MLSAATAPYIGALIDRHGGRAVLVASNVVLAAGLALLGLAQGMVSLAAAWIVLGIGMAMGLYDPAFAALTRLYGREARGAITGITLIAGFASTVGWPATAWMEHAFGWREACLIWAAINLCIAMPLNLLAIPPAPPLPAPVAGAAREPEADTDAPPGAMAILAYFFSATRFVSGALAAHLPGLLLGMGTTEVMAIVAAALVGPAQVGARIAEFGLLRSFHPLISARIASLLHPLGAAFLVALGPAGAAVFAVLHGVGNGIITIAKGTLPLAIFGPVGYGHRQGLLSIMGRGMQAIAPYAFGLVMEREGPRIALAVSISLSLVALAALLALKEGSETHEREPVPDAGERANVGSRTR